mmetsp:Transcript_67111/g.184853  ORF Transcript_67111/g.184853 Transcript_67111/m.184853 type:complete len:240 (+) Transcript_67111:2578-3297(+)
MTSIMDAVAEVVVATSETDEHLAKRMSRSIYEQFVIPCVKQSANGTWITKTFPVDETTIGALASTPIYKSVIMIRYMSGPSQLFLFEVVAFLIMVRQWSVLCEIEEKYAWLRSSLQTLHATWVAEFRHHASVPLSVRSLYYVIPLVPCCLTNSPSYRVPQASCFTRLTYLDISGLAEDWQVSCGRDGYINVDSDLEREVQGHATPPRYLSASLNLSTPMTPPDELWPSAGCDHVLARDV